MDKSEATTDSEEQEARFFLRQKFLRFLANMSNGQQCEFTMYENTQVKAKLKAFDAEFKNIAVEDLETPSLPVKNAILRSSDIISMQMNNVPVDSLTNYCPQNPK